MSPRASPPSGSRTRLRPRPADGLSPDAGSIVVPRRGRAGGSVLPPHRTGTALHGREHAAPHARRRLDSPCRTATAAASTACGRCRRRGIHRPRHGRRLPRHRIVAAALSRRNGGCARGQAAAAGSFQYRARGLRSPSLESDTFTAAACRRTPVQPSPLGRGLCSPVIGTNTPSTTTHKPGSSCLFTTSLNVARRSKMYDRRGKRAQWERTGRPLIRSSFQPGKPPSPLFVFRRGPAPIF